MRIERSKRNISYGKYICYHRKKEDNQKYCIARHQAKCATREVIKKFEIDLSRDIKEQPKQLWNYVKSKSKTKIRVSDFKTEEGMITSTDLEKADGLNTYSSRIFTKEDSTNIPSVDPIENAPQMMDIVVTVDKVLKKLLAFKRSKCPAPNGIHPHMLKELAHAVKLPLSIISNNYLYSSTIPTAWKEGNIVPIFKKSHRSDPFNYRPVSLTSVVCKALESIIRVKMVVHLMNNNLISDHQHGFRSNIYCITQLLLITEHWSKLIHIIYLDFQKTFDTVPHIEKKTTSASYSQNEKVPSL